MRKLTTYITDYFIKSETRQNEPTLHRARVLVYGLLFCAFVAIVLMVLSYTVLNNGNVRIEIGVFILVSILFLYRKNQNLELAGNLLALGFALVLAPSVLSTGGIHSDNLLYLVLPPIISLLFGRRHWSLLWFFALLAYLVYLGTVDTSHNFFPTEKPSFYFVISYGFLGILVYTLVFIFEAGQRKIIKSYRQQRRELREQRAHLKRKNNRLKRTTAELEESNALLTQFAHAASHDLKEPLRMIGMYTGLIKRQLNRPGTSENMDEYMGYVTDGVQRMEQMLTDLLDYSRVGNHDHLNTSIHLDDTLFMVVTNLTVQLKETQGCIFSPELPTIHAPASLIGQLFQNIIANGIKFRHPERAPEIHLSWEDADAFIQLNIRDNGVGIAEKDQKRIFHIFERLHTRTEYPGSGIGLATCQRIVKSLGGKIWVTSVPGAGTTFHFTLPRRFVSPVVRPHDLPVCEEGSSKIDSDRDVRTQSALSV